MKTHRKTTTAFQSETARLNGRNGSRPIKVCSRGHRWRKVVGSEKGKAIRVCPVCLAEPPSIASMISNWAAYFPDKWKRFCIEGKPLDQYPLDTRRRMQRCEENLEDEQAALDASLVSVILTKGYTTEDLAATTCGQIQKWAS